MYNKRQSSFELIRVVAMLLIVLHHSIVHGVFINNINVINESNPLTYSLFSVLGFGGGSRSISICIYNRIFYDLF